MMAEDDPPTYTTHNFDAINHYIEHLAGRHRALTAQWRSETIGTYLKWGAVAIVGSGVAAFFVLLGLSFLKERPEPRIVKPIVVDKPITINIPEGLCGGGCPKESEVDQKRRGAKKRIEQITSDQTAGPATKSVVNFVIFKEIAFNRAGIKNVVVGMRYKDAQATKPSSQWCYVTKGDISVIAIQATLSDKTGGQRVDRTITAAAAREIRATVSDLKAAQRRCEFE